MVMWRVCRWLALALVLLAVGACGCGWAVWLVLSVAPMFDGHYFHNFYGQNGVCLPFTLRNIKKAGWEYAMFIFNIINCLAFLIIATGYLVIYYSINASRQASGRAFSEKDVRLMRKITLIILSDFVCWMPIIVLSFLREMTSYVFNHF